MTSIASKNLYELLGNDPEQDPNRPPDPPTKAIDKPVPRTGKRNGPAEPAAAAPRTSGRGGRQESYGGNEGAFRDRNAGSYNNRSRAPEERRGGSEEYRGRGRGRGRGGYRGDRPPRDDRHSRTGLGEHEKQAAHGWGANTGGGEWADEKAGEALAKEEEKEGFDTNVPAPVNADGEPLTDGADAAPVEPEDKSKSYADYLAEQAEKKLQLGNLEVRKANEGASKKFPEGKALSRDEEEDFISGAGGKAKRERERKERATKVDLDDTKLYRPEPRDSFRGGRGGRGGRGEFRGESAPRGRGGRGRGGDRPPRGEFRGGRGRGPSSPNVDDQSAFPSLGA